MTDDRRRVHAHLYRVRRSIWADPMKVDVTYTHRGWFYGCPIYLAYGVDGSFLTKPVLPFTEWWCERVAPLIQETRAYLAGLLNIDTLEVDHWRIDRVRRLKKPFTESYDWADDAPAWKSDILKA
jgi:hypothetical protein